MRPVGAWIGKGKEPAALSERSYRGAKAGAERRMDWVVDAPGGRVGSGEGRAGRAQRAQLQRSEGRGGWRGRERIFSMAMHILICGIVL